MTQETATQQNEAAATTETQQAQTGGNTNAEAKFTQTDLDRLIGEARQKASDTARKKVYEEIGVDDPLTDKELLAAAKAKREADKTEAQKAVAAAAKEKERADKAEAELAAERQQRIIDRRDRAIEAAATAARAEIPSDVLAWAEKHAPDALAKTVDSDGLVAEKGVKDLLEACRKARPGWFKAGGVGSPGHGGGRARDLGADAEKRARATNQRSIRG